MHKEDRSLISRTLDLLEFLQSHGMDLDHLAENAEQLSSLPDSQNIQLAWEAIRFMDEMPGGFLIYYAEGNEEIIYANKALLRIFQCTTMEEFRLLTGNSFRGLVHPEDLEEVEKSIALQIADSQYDLDYVEYRACRKDGTIAWIEDYGHFIQTPSTGGIFYVFLNDTTEKRNRILADRARLIQEKNEKERMLQNLILRHDQERAQINQEYLQHLEIIEGLSINYDSIFYADLDKNQLLPYRLSDRSQRIFDEKYQARPYDASIAEYRDTWVHPEDRALFAQITTPARVREELSGCSTYSFNYRILQGDTPRYVQLRIVNVEPEEHISQVIMGFRNVDEELQQEMEQRQMLMEALDNANLAIVAKNTFLSNISHDMRTPLNAIFGFTTLAKQNLPDPGVARIYLDRIETSSRQLLDMISKVLELSQTESEEAHAEELECDLCEAVQAVYDFMQPQAEEKHIDFRLDCSTVRHKLVYSDPEKIKQMLLYLANNAVTYTAPGGKVSITAAEQGELPNQYSVFQLMISDTGTGISEEFLERIFEPFARERNTTLSGIHGIGLGLTIAKNIVDLLGGTIDVQSAVGEGSTFTITLQLRVHPILCTTCKDDEDFHAEGMKLLLVEDNELNREIETELLQEAGLTIETAADGQIAVEKVSRSAPGDFDLILMDIQMPVMDGWTASKAIRSLENPALAGIPIIALSANVFASDIRKSAECGIDAHLPKPMDISTLLKTMAEVARKRKTP